MDVESLHNQAMDLAEQAILARKRKNAAEASAYLLQALEKEQHAALLAVSEDEPEPTRSVLLLSAAHLAIECGEQRMAERLISQALAGNPPAEIAAQLRSLFRATEPATINGRRPQRASVRKWREYRPALARESK